MAVSAVHELVNYGPAFTSWFGIVEGELNCVMTARVLTEGPVADAVTASAERQGIDCGSCVNSNCPLARLRQTA